MPVQRWMGTTLQKLVSSIAVLALLLAGLVTLSTVSATPAKADVSAPSWWSGSCDVNNHPGSYPLGASFDGVQACGPGSYNQGGTDHFVHFYTGAWGEYEWECVELVMRYMYQVYGIAPYNAPGGKDVVANYPVGTGTTVLTPVNNDGTSANPKLPSPGDIISVGAAPVNPVTGLSPNPYGHTAVVTGYNYNADGSIKSIIDMQQNATANGVGTLTVSNGKVTGTVLGGGVTGWLHNPNAGSTTSPPDTDGDTVPDSDDLAPTIPGPVNNRGIPNFSPKMSGDFNGDGKSDIAVFYAYGSNTTSLFVFYGETNGFSDPVNVWNSGSGNWSWARILPVVGDFNGDGKSDIAVFYDYGSDDTALFTFTAPTSGTSFADPTKVWESGSGNFRWSSIKPVVGDFNGDGKPDIAVLYDYGSDDTALFTFTAPSSGTSFADPTKVWESGSGNWRWANDDQLVGDFNGDGKPDIEAIYSYGTAADIFVFVGYGNGTFSPPYRVWSSGAGNWDWDHGKSVSGDFNGDGKSDIAVLYDYGSNTTSLFEFPGTSSGPTAPTSVWNSGPGNWAWSQILVP